MQKIYLMSLYVVLGFITLLVIMTKSRPVLVRKKVLLGLLILSLTSPAATLVSCSSGKNIFRTQKDIWKTTGWVDGDTYRIAAQGMPKQGLTNVTQKKGYARDAAILNAQKAIIEKFTYRVNESCAGMSDYSASGIALAKELGACIKGGSVIAIKYDEEFNCEIIYEVKRKGLKKLVTGTDME